MHPDSLNHYESNNDLKEDNKAALTEREGDAVWTVLSCRLFLTLQCRFSGSA